MHMDCPDGHCFITVFNLARYVMMLDLSKAFDRVSYTVDLITGMFGQLPK